MSKICQITGKKAMVGNNVSHSLRRTKRLFNVNLFIKKFFYVEEDCWIQLRVSAAGLRIINRVAISCGSPFIFAVADVSIYPLALTEWRHQRYCNDDCSRRMTA